MEQLLAICFDLIAVGIILGFMNAAAQKGFLRTVVQMAAYLIILVASAYLSRAAAPVIYDYAVQPILFEHSQSEENSNPENAALISTVPRGTLSMVDTALDSFDSLLSDELQSGALLKDFTQAAVRPLMIKAISMISFFLFFAVLSLLSNLLLSTLGLVNHIPVIGTLNAILGGTVGVFQGLLMVLVLCVLAKGILHLHPAGWKFLNTGILERTYVCQYLLNLNLIRRLFA